MPLQITEATTNQEILDYVTAHLRNQGRRSVASANATCFMGACLYRGPDGLSCAVGCLIPDEEYRPDMERRFDELVDKFPRIGIYLRLAESCQRKQILMNLQRIHDNHEHWNRDGFSARGEGRIRFLAQTFGLVYQPPALADLETAP